MHGIHLASTLTNEPIPTYEIADHSVDKPDLGKQEFKSDFLISPAHCTIIQLGIYVCIWGSCISSVHSMTYLFQAVSLEFQIYGKVSKCNFYFFFLKIFNFFVIRIKLRIFWISIVRPFLSHIFVKLFKVFLYFFLETYYLNSGQMV